MPAVFGDGGEHQSQQQQQHRDVLLGIFNRLNAAGCLSAFTIRGSAYFADRHLRAMQVVCDGSKLRAFSVNISECTNKVAFVEQLTRHGSLGRISFEDNTYFMAFYNRIGRKKRPREEIEDCVELDDVDSHNGEYVDDSRAAF